MNFNLKVDSNKMTKLLALFGFILLSNVSVFGQSVSTVTVTNVTVETVTVQKGENSNVNFILWFMGSKQDPNTTISSEGNNTRKQIMTSGTAPNRLLIKTFLKKAVSFESTIV